jgi:ketosteroid isomerase-like protein
VGAKRDNERIVREMYEVFNDEGVEATAAYYDDDLVWHSDPSFPEGGTINGAGGVVRYMRRMFDNWEKVELRLDDVVAHDHRVLALLTMINTGRDGIVMEGFWGHLWTVDEGRMVDVRSFLNRDAALEAIGSDGRPERTESDAEGASRPSG